MLKADGIQLYYEMVGPGVPLLLIMGLRRNAEWWYRHCFFLEDCQEFNRRVTAFLSDPLKNRAPWPCFFTGIVTAKACTLHFLLGKVRAHGFRQAGRGRSSPSSFNRESGGQRMAIYPLRC